MPTLIETLKVIASMLIGVSIGIVSGQELGFKSTDQLVDEIVKCKAQLHYRIERFNELARRRND